MKSKKWKSLGLLVLICCVLYGIGNGLYYELSDNNISSEEKSINWKKGIFRLTLVVSILLGVLGGSFFAYLAKKDKLADEDDGDPPPKMYTEPKLAFLYFSIFISGCVWFIYFIIQFPVYFIFIFLLNGFMN